ncbi:MAG: integrase core domain-containing protein [Acidobacteria bacterium]|nr:integrase core domain-containing protein [Acidobacteriota bacterium]
MLRDRDRIFGKDVVDQIKAMGISEVLSEPRSPWQRVYVERVIGTIRRECLDHVIVFGKWSLYRRSVSCTTIIGAGRTWAWRTTDQNIASSNRRTWGGLFACRKSADSIIVTSAAPHDGIFGAIPGAIPPALAEGPCAGLLTVTGTAPVKRGNRPCQSTTRGE